MLQVKDELKRYTDILLSKTRSVQRMMDTLSLPHNPKPTTGTEESPDLSVVISAKLNPLKGFV